MLPTTINDVFHSICNTERAAFGMDVLEDPDVAVEVPVMGVAIGLVGA